MLAVSGGVPSTVEFMLSNGLGGQSGNALEYGVSGPEMRLLRIIKVRAGVAPADPAQRLRAPLSLC
jgi:hypothetical protein